MTILVHTCIMKIEILKILHMASNSSSYFHCGILYSVVLRRIIDVSSLFEQRVNLFMAVVCLVNGITLEASKAMKHALFIHFHHITYVF